MSGAGKSTLVRCINMLERPTEGSALSYLKGIPDIFAEEVQKNA